MKRRGFIRKVSIIMASAAGTVVSLTFLRQLSPKVIRANMEINVGKLKDFPVDTYTFLNDYKLFIYRDHGSMKAVSAVCTHLGCTIKRTAEGFECPCHGSCYSEQGRVLSGPAPRDLYWFSMEKRSDDSIIVNLEEKTTSPDNFYLSIL